jgi:hypothetical protein
MGVSSSGGATTAINEIRKKRCVYRDHWVEIPYLIALRLALPVEDHGNRGRIDRVSRGVDEDSLAIGRDDVLLSYLKVVFELDSKQRDGSAGGAVAGPSAQRGAVPSWFD